MNIHLKPAFCVPFFIALTLYSAGCKSNQNAADNTSNPQDQAQTADAGATDDPANANVVPVSNSAAPAPRSTSETASGTGAGESYQEPTASSVANEYPESQYNADNGYGQEPQTYAPQPPPALPTYQQPPAPGDGYMWTPGNWNYASTGYYWVPGAWVMAPYQGALWTPGYWGSRGGRYAYYPGSWGRQIGYYGGINYGNGYGGFGYQGGYWRGNQFAYNRAVNNVNTSVVRNVYVYNVRNVTTTDVSYNGGPGGVQYRPHPAELVAMHAQRNPPMASQVQIAREAQANRNNFASVNRGRPATVVVTHAIAADRNVTPPRVVRYASVRVQQHVPVPVQRPAEAQQRPEAARHEAPRAETPQQAEQQRAEQSRQQTQQRAGQQKQEAQQRAEQSRQQAQQRAEQQRQATQQRAVQTRQQTQQHAEQQRQTAQQKAEQQRQEEERRKPQEQRPQ